MIRGRVHGFNEKPQMEEAYVNGGFMVCDYRLFDYLPDDPEVMFEREPIATWSATGSCTPINMRVLAADGYLPGDAVSEPVCGKKGRRRGRYGMSTDACWRSVQFTRGKRVLVTGHTGFKGSWLCEWLLGPGAEVTGYSLPPPTAAGAVRATRPGRAAPAYHRGYPGSAGA